MQLYPLKLVTIIVESLLKEQICKKGMEFGATGFTSSEAGGHGSRGTRNQDNASGMNVRIEFLVPESVAAKILTYVSHQYHDHYAVVAWQTDADVVRGQKYAEAVR
jgi:nitrogen regulatory protein P-II 2